MAQGTADLGNLRSLGGFYTLTSGGKPGSGIIVTPAQSSVPLSSTLVLSYGAVTLRFPNTRIIDSNFFLRDGRWLMRHAIQDGRWQLEATRVNGRFNRRGGDGEPIDDDTKKNTKELFEEIATQANVTINATAAPTSEYPEVDWSNTSAADAIDALCKREGLHFAVQSDGSYRIFKQGDGGDLPINGSFNNGNRTFEFKRPRYLEVVGGPTIFQGMFKLRAIAQERDGTWKQPIDLSYRPVTGWGSESPEFFTGLGANRDLALRTVWRYYQASEWQDQPVTAPEITPNDIDEVSQVTMFDTLLESASDKLTDDPLNVKGRVYGVFANGAMLMPATAGNTQYLGEYELDGEERRLHFKYPVYKFTGGQVAEADLVYLCSYNARHKDGKLNRFSLRREYDANSAGTHTIHREDLVRRIQQNYRYGGLGWQKDNQDDNLTDLKAKANTLLDLVEKKFEPGRDIEYDGFRSDVLPNGKIVRTRFDWGNDTYASTRASTNMDSDFFNR